MSSRVSRVARTEEDHEYRRPCPERNVEDHPGASCVGFLFAFALCSDGERIGGHGTGPDPATPSAQGPQPHRYLRATPCPSTLTPTALRSPREVETLQWIRALLPREETRDICCLTISWPRFRTRKNRSTSWTTSIRRWSLRASTYSTSSRKFASRSVPRASACGSGPTPPARRRPGRGPETSRLHAPAA